MVIKALSSSDARAQVLDRISDSDVAAKAQMALAAGKCFVLSMEDASRSLHGEMVTTQRGPVQGGTVEHDGKVMQKWLPKPLAFFMWDDDADRLMPLAIEVVRGGRVFTPADHVPAEGGFMGLFQKEGKDDWLFAKMCVGVADAIHHEMYSHLGLGHFCSEPIVVSLNRHLHVSHPVSLLLKSHMRFTLCNNFLGRNTLVKPGMSVDKCVARSCCSTHECLKAVDLACPDNTVFLTWSACLLHDIEAPCVLLYRMHGVVCMLGGSAH